MIEGWIFTIGGILGYITMLFHSLLYRDKYKTIYIFALGWLSSFVMEYYLIQSLGQYEYQNVPFIIFEVVPVIIPTGWVVTFYGLYSIAEDLIDNEKARIMTTGVYGTFFGIGIEVLARNSDFWIFHFDYVRFWFIPLNVVASWGLTTMVFASGISALKKWEFNAFKLILLIVMVSLLNLGIASLLSI